MLLRVYGEPGQRRPLPLDALREASGLACADVVLDDNDLRAVPLQDQRCRVLWQLLAAFPMLDSSREAFLCVRVLAATAGRHMFAARAEKTHQGGPELPGTLLRLQSSTAASKVCARRAMQSCVCVGQHRLLHTPDVDGLSIGGSPQEGGRASFIWQRPCSFKRIKHKSTNLNLACVGLG